MAESRRRRRLFTATWTIALTVLTISLIYWEKTAILYILATLGLSALLSVVAFSDLGGRREQPTDDSSAQQ